MKVLAVDEDAVHIRVYKERFSTRPATVDTDGLTLGSIDDADGFGVGHLPLTHEEFALWQPARRPTLLARLRDWLGRRA